MSCRSVTLVLVTLVHVSVGLRITLVDMPSPVHLGGRARLSCFFQLAPAERVYTVNWYHNGREFFRFSPAERPAIQTFSQPGVFVDGQVSNISTVVLQPVTLRSAGQYDCEIATEAPRYVTVRGHGHLAVVVVPSGGPHISGDRGQYRLGEEVQVNCTSARSRPAASLTWYLNDQQVDPSLVRDYQVLRNVDGLDTSKIGLRFRLRSSVLDTDGVLTIRCAAHIASHYWRSHERRLRLGPTELAARTSIPANSVEVARLDTPLVICCWPWMLLVYDTT